MTPEEKDQKVREVIAKELEQVALRRHALGLGEPPSPNGLPGPDVELYEKAGKQDLVGLAFSGGGIRSATFNLGVLQGLAGLRLLKYADYLSTVSGGGYIGGWFVAWLRRAPGGLEDVAPQLRPERIDQDPPAKGDRPRGAASEPGPIFHLRRFSNYLSPRLGLLSADVWVLWATYLRNLLVCQLVLLPAAVGVLLISRLLLLLYHTRTPEFAAQFAAGALGEDGGEPADLISGAEWWLGGGIIILWFLAAFFAFLGSGRVRGDEAQAGDGADKPLSAPNMIGRIVLPVLLSAVLFCWIPGFRLYKQDHLAGGTGPGLVLGLPWFPADASKAGGRGALDWGALHNYLAVQESVRDVFLAFALIPAVVVLAAYVVALLFHRRWRDAGAHLLWIGAACITGGILLFSVYDFLSWLCRPGRGELTDYVHARAAARVTTFGPPLVLGVIVLTIYLGIALLRTRLGEGLREWWSSLCSWLMIFAASWMLVNLVAIYATAAVIWAGPWVQGRPRLGLPGHRRRRGPGRRLRPHRSPTAAPRPARLAGPARPAGLPRRPARRPLPAAARPPRRPSQLAARARHRRLDAIPRAAAPPHSGHPDDGLPRQQAGRQRTQGGGGAGEGLRRTVRHQPHLLGGHVQHGLELRPQLEVLSAAERLPLPERETAPGPQGGRQAAGNHRDARGADHHAG
jgi:uncharacterized membrane protein YgdD (TMEM256/DUF423 family)